MLEDQFELILANAHEIKALPGRKTDVRDCEWIADLLRHGLIRPSFIRGLAHPGAARSDALEHLPGLSAHAGNQSITTSVLETANITLTSVVSDVWGKSGQSMIKAIMQGESDAQTRALVSTGNLARQTPSAARSSGRTGPTASPSSIAADFRPSAVLGVLHASLHSRRSKRRWNPLKR